jgi:ribonucleoside-diphosphate reductase beta chain
MDGSQATMMELFGDDWARAWMAEINADAAWSKAGRGWRGGIIFRMWPSGRSPARSLFIDLVDGECRAARRATDRDEASAPWIFGAAPETWQKMVEGEIDPIAGIMQGRLKLERGNIIALAPHARAAKALLASASRVDQRGRSESSAGEVNGSAYAPAPARATSSDPTTASLRPLDPTLFPMKLWQLAKKAGSWDPRDIRLDRDTQDWKSLDPVEKQLLLNLGLLFHLGKQTVMPGILPLFGVLVSEGRLEEGIYLTSFLAEEARHYEMFHRFLVEVAKEGSDPKPVRSSAYARLLDHELPSLTSSLRADPTPVNQARAWVTHNLMIEGVLAQTGYRAFHEILERNGIMPGMQRAIQYVKSDEDRHLQWGTWVLARLSAEHGEPVRAAISDRIVELTEPALAVVHDVTTAWETLPFGLSVERFAEVAAANFRHRIASLEALRAKSLDDLMHASPAD